jgi:hypothetical protein
MINEQIKTQFHLWSIFCLKLQIYEIPTMIFSKNKKSYRSVIKICTLYIFAFVSLVNTHAKCCEQQNPEMLTAGAKNKRKRTTSRNERGSTPVSEPINIKWTRSRENISSRQHRGGYRMNALGPTYTETTYTEEANSSCRMNALDIGSKISIMRPCKSITRNVPLQPNIANLENEEY